MEYITLNRDRAITVLDILTRYAALLFKTHENNKDDENLRSHFTEVIQSAKIVLEKLRVIDKRFKDIVIDDIVHELSSVIPTGEKHEAENQDQDQNQD